MVLITLAMLAVAIAVGCLIVMAVSSYLDAEDDDERP